MSLPHFLTKLHRNIPALLLVGIVVFSGSAFLYAAAPSGGYNPGDTLDPDCAPNDADCFVNIPIGGGSATATNGLQLISGDIGLGGVLTEQYTFIDGDGINETGLIFGTNNALSDFTVITSNAAGGSGEINFEGDGFNVVTTAQNGVHVSTDTNSTNGNTELIMGDITSALAQYSVISASGVSLLNNFQQPSGDESTMGFFFADVDDFGNVPFMRFVNQNNTSGEGVYLQMVGTTDVGDKPGLSLGYDDGATTDMSISGNGGIQFKIDDVRTFSIPAVPGLNGYILQTDASGYSSWIDPSGLGGAVTLDLYAENASLIDLGNASPVVTGDYSVAIGVNSKTAADNSYAIGGTIGGSGDASIALGMSSNSNSIEMVSIGFKAGASTTATSYSNFIGSHAGDAAGNAFSSNFFGQNAGTGATDASLSNFIGSSAGNSAQNANNSNFIGDYAGSGADNASRSNFIGSLAGSSATNAQHSNFMGDSAGANAANAENSIFIGRSAGANDTVDNTSSNLVDNCSVLNYGCYSVLIGNNSSTGGFSNSIALGNNATNTDSNQFMIGSTSNPIDEMYIVSSGGNCSVTTTGISCSSDRTLKKDISNISNGLDIVTQLSGVTYHWLNDEVGTKRIPGFIAQDVEPIIPEAVTFDERTGKYSMNYTQIIPYLVEAVKTLNVAINSGTTTGAQVGEFIADTIRAREKLCVGDTCFNENELKQILEIKNEYFGEEESNNDNDQDETVIPEETLPADETPANEDPEATTELDPVLETPIEIPVIVESPAASVEEIPESIPEEQESAETI